MTITIVISLNYSFLSAASISAITRVMIYGIVCITLIVLPQKEKRTIEIFQNKVRKHQSLLLGVLITLWLLSSSKINELRDIAISIGNSVW
jgi:amino acid transporter